MKAMSMVKRKDGSLLTLIKDSRHLINLIMMLILWIASALNFYLIRFQLKYIQGDIYTNTIVSAVSEVSAYLISGVIYERIGTKCTFICSYLISILGAIFLITTGNENNSVFIPIMILGAKFGISSAFNCVYLANTVFPPIYASTTFGVCNFVARLLSMVAP